MKSFTLQGTLAATPHQVFAVLSDLEGAKDWMPELKEVRDVSGPMSVGAAWTEVRLPAGRKKPMTSRVQVTEFAPDVSFAIRVIDKMVDLSFRFGLEPEGTGTRVTYDAQGRMKGLMMPFSGKLMAMVQKGDQDLLQRLEKQALTKAGKSKRAPSRKPATLTQSAATKPVADGKPKRPKPAKASKKAK